MQKAGNDAMSGYLGYFIDHGGQLAALLTVAVVWLGLTALGAYLAGGQRLKEATPFYGWAAVSLVFTLGGIFTPVSFTVMSTAVAVLAVLAGVAAWRRDGTLLPPALGKVLLLTLPLLILVSAMVGSQWDEFTDWLFTPRQLWLTDRFPDQTNKHLSGSLAAYPFNWHFITYLASRLGGHLVESAGAMVNVLLLLSFGLYLAGLVNEQYGQAPSRKGIGWGLCALGALLVIPFNPTFAQKVVLTSYADTATAVALGFATVLGWQLLNALGEQRLDKAKGLAFQLGLVLLVLINMKQATLALFLLIVGALILTALRDSSIRFTDLLRRLPVIVIPALTVYLAWRYHVANELGGKELSVRPLAEWYITEIPQILLRMLLVFSKKGLYLALFLLVLVFALRGLIRMQGPFDRLAVIVGAIMLGYNGFLLFSYVAVFGEFDALRAASLWRYNMHLGPVLILFTAYAAAGWAGKRRPAVLQTPWPGRIAVVLIVAAPFLFAEKLRFDKAKHVPFYRGVGADLTEVLREGNSLIVIDPRGSGESAAVTRFQLGNKDIFKSYMSVYHHPTEDNIRKVLAGGYSHALIHSVTPELQRVIDLGLQKTESYLLQRDGDAWRILKRWQVPEGFQAR